MSDVNEKINSFTPKKPGITHGRKTKKLKKFQIPIGISAIVGVVIFGIFLSNISVELVLFWITGICFGFILQRSRFCFTAAVRDPALIRITSLTRAVLIASAITTIGFTAIKYGAYTKGLNIPGQDYVVPISFATAAGAFIFGIGMVIASGCAVTTLTRVGEGFTIQMITLVFFIIGSLWGVHDFEWWDINFISKGKALFLPDVFGWFGAVVLQLIVIGCLFMAAYKWEYRDK